jgi:flagellar export protein FliJ
VKFQFSLETVLHHREHLEHEAMQAYADAKRTCDQHMADIHNMYLQIDQARREIDEHARGVGTPEHITMLDNFIEGQKIRITRARLKARELLAIVEEKHEALLAAARDKQSLLKLKERHWLSFRKKRKKLQMKQLDEIVTTRTRRGGNL